MAGTLRNSPIDDPVTRAAKNVTDSVERLKRTPILKDDRARAALMKDLRDFDKAKGKTKAERRYGTK